jgi:hypothetical protein
MLDPKKPWDPGSLRSRFFEASLNADRYVNENVYKVKRGGPWSVSSCQMQVDAYSAKSDLYRDLSNTNALDSREKLLAHLRHRLKVARGPVSRRGGGQEEVPPVDEERDSDPVRGAGRASARGIPRRNTCASMT